MSNSREILLGVNIDHVATLRQARGTRYPEPLEELIMPDENGFTFLNAKTIPLDPGGNEYQYDPPMPGQPEPRVYTLGKDGQVELMKAIWETPESRPLVRGMINRLPFSEMTNEELGGLALHFFEEDQVLTSRFIGKIDFAKLTGTQIASLAAGFCRLDKLIGQSLMRKVRWSSFR